MGRFQAKKSHWGGGGAPPGITLAILEQIRPVDRNQACVLVVDDILPIVEEMLTLLELNGIIATSACSLKEAEEALAEFRNISVVVCDVRLGKESGIDLMKHARANKAISARKLEYLFVTGDPTGIEQFQQDHRPTVMTKPVRPKEFINLINYLLARN